MTNKIKQRTYLFLKGKLASPLLSGSGETNETKNDVVVDAFNHPFVPGSSLAGAFRHQLEQIFVLDKNEIDSLFGNKERQSRLIVHSMKINNEKITIRDGVELSEDKLAKEKALYHYQVIETGASWEIRLEWVIRDENDEKNTNKEKALINGILEGIDSGHFRIGAKTNRGFGKLTLKSVQIEEFNYEKKEDAKRWLTWCWDCLIKSDKNVIEDKRLLGNDQIKLDKTTHFSLWVPLALKDTLMIRSYRIDEKNEDGNLNSKEDEQKNEDDYVHLQANGKSVIPGTTWAGAIRSRLSFILDTSFKEMSGKTKLIEALFGSSTTVLKDEKLQASFIQVDQSVLNKDRSLSITRNAIDRFTGGTVEGALYTGKVAVRGETELVLRWTGKNNGLSNEAICGMLLWVIKDLQEGFLAIGGETSVGRGIFKKHPTKKINLNGQELTNESAYFKEAARAVKEWNNGLT
ncbi:CRISPR/Cas system CSM-associated protein Csm3 (group 7 of RAMP superfamily) [Alkalihalobacillus xiaoxiensis]|uniref:CRISPR/Cas system CSM-associated protein Csm3 (Group 7 of RAMP superfamily) n=1 Tax=Shouchella xiaoxiensis TaxID=766895 RepID=A0ABS2SU89_9BACI|nr:RAMP superfamily CRISPR-associated protein [Shouchella xiaoxiensis]MBM7839104.1 CRISPR/Cas system CSM-associated protein Csm3 (group 7 of RAMP superfamily) [Shouchella xiaoxiensis]